MDKWLGVNSQFLDTPDTTLIAMMSHGRHDLSNHRKSDCLFNNLLAVKPTRTSSLQITGLVAGEHPTTRWGRVTHICVSQLTIIGPYNGLSPGQRQVIISTSARIFLIRTLGTNSVKSSAKFIHFHSKKWHLKMSAKWRQFCLNG